MHRLITSSPAHQLTSSPTTSCALGKQARLPLFVNGTGPFTVPSVTMVSQVIAQRTKNNIFSDQDPDMVAVDAQLAMLQLEAPLPTAATTPARPSSPRSTPPTSILPPSTPPASSPRPTPGRGDSPCGTPGSTPREGESRAQRYNRTVRERAAERERQRGAKE